MKGMKEFTEREWATVDTEHFGRPSRWTEEDMYIRAEEDGEIQGVLHHKINGGVMEIITIIVSEKHRGQGIGSMLILKAEENARQKKAHKIYLTTGDGWKSVEFYKKLGFIQTGELKKHYLKHDWLEFSKFL